MNRRADSMDLNDRIESLLEKVQKAPRYTGGEMNTAVKKWEDCQLHFAFCFPDTYEVGMSHLGLKILYGLINKEDWSLCERVFMPWVDMIELMKKEDIPLFSIESLCSGKVLTWIRFSMPAWRIWRSESSTA